jgi:hypothetical protein
VRAILFFAFSFRIKYKYSRYLYLLRKKYRMRDVRTIRKTGSSHLIAYSTEEIIMVKRRKKRAKDHKRKTRKSHKRRTHKRKAHKRKARKTRRRRKSTASAAIMAQE